MALRAGLLAGWVGDVEDTGSGLVHLQEFPGSPPPIEFISARDFSGSEPVLLYFLLTGLESVCGRTPYDVGVPLESVVTTGVPGLEDTEFTMRLGGGDLLLLPVEATWFSVVVPPLPHMRTVWRGASLVDTGGEY